MRKEARRAAAPDTLSDGGAAESAKVLSRAPKGTTVSMTVTGSQKFDGLVNGSRQCSFGRAARSPTVKVEAFSRDAQVTFEIINPQEGTIPVTSVARQPAGSRACRACSSFFTARATATDTAPRPSPTQWGASDRSPRATSLASAVGRHHGSDLALSVHWECE